MLKKKVKVYENGELKNKEVLLKGSEYISAVENELKEKVIRGNATPNEVEKLSRISGNDVDATRAIQILATGVAELVTSVKLIAETMASQTISQDVETPVEEETPIE